ncbi:MAG: helix-turn-helix domain-containing protein [Chloroflexi bacterium]|nr:helix-turn-helix domain-containing protein [Chloroflexota bacterium]
MNTVTLVPEAGLQIVMNVHEVARYLRLSEAKIYRMAKQGTIPAFQAGRAWRFRKDLIDDWIVRLSTLPDVGARDKSEAAR